MGVPYDLTCWYLNARRIVELTGLVSESGSRGQNEHLAKLSALRELKESVVGWMKYAKPEPLDVMLSRDSLEIGKIFTCHSNFFFSGLSKVHDAVFKGKVPKPATAYTKLDHWKPGARLTFKFHHEHLTSNSSWSELAGQKRIFILGVVTDMSELEIRAIPYVIANLVDAGGGYGLSWQNHLELHPSQIDAFSKIGGDSGLRLTRKSIDQLKGISEAEVKAVIADLIGEPVVPKDWGGESSDLFSARVEVDGRRISTAFLLKGPSRFHPMTPADLGKNGDQIGRLFDEPADLLILQHCHEVTNAVRKQMRAYAQQMGNPRRFCIIDGYDTIRILTAYGRCGFAPDQAVRGSAA